MTTETPTRTKADDAAAGHEGHGVSAAGPAKEKPPLPAHVAPQVNDSGTSPSGGHDEEEIPKDLRKPHFLVVAGVAVLFVALLAGLFFVGWVPHERQKGQIEADAREQAAFVPTVNVATPKLAAATHELLLPCDVRPNQETLIFPRAMGYLKKLNVDIQDHVEAGEVLAEIASPDLDAQLDQAKANVRQNQADIVKAQADLALTQRTFERYENIKDGSVTVQETDERRTARDQAAAAVDQAKANLGAAQANVERLTVLQGFEKITAPFSGIITARNYDVGALLNTESTGRPMFRLTQSTTLRVFVNVPQVEASDVKAGQEALLTVRNFPAKQFTGVVARLAGAIDPNTRTMPFELHFPNPNNELYAGMYGEVKLAVTSRTQSLLVPTSALIFDASGVRVATVRDGKVHFETVLVGRDLGTELEITKGLAAGDHVITNPGARMAEGGAVNVIDSDKPRLAEANASQSAIETAKSTAQ